MIDRSLLTFDGIAQIAGSSGIRIIDDGRLAGSGEVIANRIAIHLLPFRLRLGDELTLDVRGVSPAHIRLRNEISGSAAQEAVLPGKFPLPRDLKLWTTAVVLLPPTTVMAAEQQAMHAALHATDFSQAIAPFNLFHPWTDEVLRPLNRLITTYKMVFAKEVRFNRVVRLSRRDLAGGHSFSVL